MTKNKGFTLMELLIVIGVLGILAAGLLAAIDPFEQLKKARDANNRNASIELLNAFTRYYATHGEFPWNFDSGDVTCDLDSTVGVPGAMSAGVVDIDTMEPCIDLLEADGELKPDFNDNVRTDVYVFSNNDTHVAVCFAPEGKALRSDINTKWVLDTDTVAESTLSGVTCPDVTSTDCLQCFY